jgi:hypothetical protein
MGNGTQRTTKGGVRSKDFFPLFFNYEIIIAYKLILYNILAFVDIFLSKEKVEGTLVERGNPDVAMICSLMRF